MRENTPCKTGLVNLWVQPLRSPRPHCCLAASTPTIRPRPTKASFARTSSPSRSTATPSAKIWILTISRSSSTRRRMARDQRQGHDQRHQSNLRRLGLDAQHQRGHRQGRQARRQRLLLQAAEGRRQLPDHADRTGDQPHLVLLQAQPEGQQDRRYLVQAQVEVGHRQAAGLPRLFEAAVETVAVVPAQV